MKVMCIDNVNRLPDYGVYLHLTINEWYDIVKKIEYQFLIKNDIGNFCYYDERRFISEREYRKNKLEKLENI